MTDLNDQEREALERRAQDAAGMSSSKYPGARARELIIWRSARRFEAALAAREDTERPDGPTDDDLTELIEMPRDLARVLRDPGIVVKQDGAIFDLIAKWQNAPTPTMSGPVQDPEQEREAKQ
jgi:hypothetical protein